MLPATCRSCVDYCIDLVFGLFCFPRKRVPKLDKQHSILLESAVCLADQIKCKQITSEELIRAYIERIKLVNPIINAVTDERFEGALQDAREVDKLIESGFIPMDKPFLGVPFTAKESYAAAGMLHTLGLKARECIRATEDAESIRLLKEAGAILIAVTNVPELCRWIETRNMVFGQTCNPHHSGRTVGGSSGGEAALSAAIATPISLCGDTGGSTRMPAFYCGLYGYLPTAGHTNNKGSLLNDRNKPSIGSVSFLSRHWEDLIPLTKVIAAEEASDLNLDTIVNIKTLHYHYVVSTQDALVSPICHDLQDAMTKVIKFLTRILPAEKKPKLYYNSGFNYMYELWKHCMSYQDMDFPRMLSNGQRTVTFRAELAKKLICCSDFTLAAILALADSQVFTPVNHEWAEMILKILRDDLIRVLGQDGVLLFPSSPLPAPFHYTSLFRPYNFAYWAIINALRFPSVQVPLGVNESGLPLGIQVVAAPCRDALCLAVARVLGDVFGGVVPPCEVTPQCEVMPSC